MWHGPPKGDGHTHHDSPTPQKAFSWADLRRSRLEPPRPASSASSSSAACAPSASSYPFPPSPGRRRHKMVDPIFDFQFRIILIGDSTVGKSSILRYFTDGTFAEVSDPTVGVDFFARLIKVHDGTNIKLQLWDTAGQERFRSITKSYYRNSVGALLVYDICNQESFRHLSVWMMEARRHIEPHKAVFILVGCKHDLVLNGGGGDEANREVSFSEAEAFAELHKIPFVETSAKTGYNVEEAFSVLAQQIYDKIENGEYKLEDGWDGIKRGYFGHGGAGGVVGVGGAASSGGRVRTSQLIEGTPASKKCC